MGKIPKVPVVMQMELVECGAASLSMILAYYGKWLPLEQVRSDCGVSRDGSKAKNILQAARNYGLDAVGAKVSPLKIKEKTMPCIIFWQRRHFVVLKGFQGSKVYINDPAKGAVTIDMEEFLISYSGICLTFEVTERFEKSGQPPKVMNFVKSYIGGTTAGFVYMGVSGIMLTIIGITIAYMGYFFVDNLLVGNYLSWIGLFFPIMIGLLFMQMILSVANALYLLKLNGRLGMVANTRFMWHVLRLPMSFFAGRRIGDILSRQRSNETIAKTMMVNLAPLAVNVVMMFFYLVAMLRLNPLLASIGIICSITNLVLLRVISNKKVNISRLQMKDKSALLAETLSGIKMIETLKAAGIEKSWFERFAGNAANVNASNVKFATINQTLGALPMLFQSISSAIVLVLGAYLVLIGNFTAGMLLTFQAFLTAFMAPMNELLSVGQILQEMRTDMERIEDVMYYKTDVPEEVEYLEDGVEYEKLKGEVELKNVCFGYSPLEAPLIEDFSIKITQGQKVAFVGGSGSGKSTIAKLIAGLYLPWSGDVLYDNKSKDEIPNPNFTSSLSVISQDITIFEDTVSNNIKMWDSSIMDFEMILAAKDAQIHDTIMQREGGYQSMLKEEGKNLSGGEKQRLEIARVLAGDPTIVIMDEATSALDASTEFKVVQAIADRNCTCIVVAHRLSTIRDCDEIVVLDKGKVIERGTHEELMQLNGLYTTLVTIE